MKKLFRYICRRLIKARPTETVSDCIDRHKVRFQKNFLWWTYDKYDSNMLKCILENQGINKGDTIFVQSSWRHFYNFRGTPKDVIRVLLGCVGTEGTVAMPVYGVDKSIFDLKLTPSAAGVITEVFRTQYEVKRSCCSHYSVAAVGKNADNLIGEHYKSVYGFDEFSPLYKLAFIPNSKIVFLGLSNRPSKISIFHCASFQRRNIDIKFKKLYSKEYVCKIINEDNVYQKKMMDRMDGYTNCKGKFQYLFNKIKNKK